MSSLASSQGGGPDVIFYHLPPNFAQAFIVLMQIFAAFLGMSIFDLVCHFSFDVQLLFSKGWREPFKVIARLSYLTCRYTSPVLLICVIIFMTVPIKDCASFITGVNAVLVLNLNAVSLIFVHRTMVLWDWEARIVIPLIAAWLCVLGVSIVVLPWYGVGMSLPNSNFCIFDTRRQERMPYTLSYKISSLALDFAIMCLTLHRLLEGGLRSLFTGKGRSFIGNTGLSKTLARQGQSVVYYGSQWSLMLMWFHYRLPILLPPGHHRRSFLNPLLVIPRQRMDLSASRQRHGLLRANNLGWQGVSRCSQGGCCWRHFTRLPRRECNGA